MALNNNSEECSDKLRAKIEEWLKWDQVNSELEFNLWSDDQTFVWIKLEIE